MDLIWVLMVFAVVFIGGNGAAKDEQASKKKSHWRPLC
jgi:hypothetical protein